MRINVFKKQKNNREDAFEILKEGKYDSKKFERAVERAYMSDSFVKYLKDNNVVFEQGSGRKVTIPVDIVEDILMVKVELPRR